MGVRTLTLGLVLRALFLHTDAYDRLRDDDNPLVEGLFLVVLIGALTALLNFVGQAVMAATQPSMAAIEQVVLETLQGMPWWPSVANNPNALADFTRWWDRGWQVLPTVFGAPSVPGAAFNILAWPLLALLGWLVYGLLAHLFARLLGGTGALNQTLGTLALATTPLLLRGLQIIPFLTIGGVMATWQLICRYRALRSVHRFNWQRAALATVLPFAVYLLLALIGIAIAVIILGATGR